MLLHESDTNCSKPRIEYKYFVHGWARTGLLNDLEAFCQDDAHSAGQPDGYTVASIYYENLAFKSYHDKMEGQQDRFKLRVRFYPDAPNADALKIEMKYKRVDRILKGQAQLSQEQFTQILEGDFSHVPYLTDTTLNHYYRMVKANGYRPAYRIDYRRKAYFARNDTKVRVTMDSDIRGALATSDLNERPQLPITPPGVHVLEIKSPGYMPFWLTRIVKKYGLQRTAVSKYAAVVRSLLHNGACRYGQGMFYSTEATREAQTTINTSSSARQDAAGPMKLLEGNLICNSNF